MNPQRRKQIAAARVKVGGIAADIQGVIETLQDIRDDEECARDKCEYHHERACGDPDVPAAMAAVTRRGSGRARGPVDFSTARTMSSVLVR